MTGLNGNRVYLDWNATAPLRPEGRAAMLAAMDEVGNPSSVHNEGRVAKKIIERARAQIAALMGCESSEIVFTSGATEAALLSVGHHSGRAAMSGVEHDCLQVYRDRFDDCLEIALDSGGVVHPMTIPNLDIQDGDLCILQAANSETGITQNVFDFGFTTREAGAISVTDAVQQAGKLEMSLFDDRVDWALISAHKFGGPKGVGAAITRCSFDAIHRGGGQEQGRRSGTENVIGIAGFGAAAEAAQRDLEAGVWEPVEKLRNILEETLAEAAPETIFFGQESPRLPNTSCFAVPGWTGETQVMQMDLAGFAISAGSACSSGKVNKASRVVLAMGFDEVTASSAIRVSMGPTTTEAEVMAFAQTWIDHYNRRKSRAA
ncbi:MAG: aminotransferase class V-fold PLP-dependent enzyme [Pseudomonadota bacterium]